MVKNCQSGDFWRNKDIKKEIIKNRKGQNIVTIIEKTENQKGLVFIMHGLGGFKEQPHIQTIADAFKENRYTVLRFDATNSIGKSDGKLELATITNYYEDLEDVIGWSKTQPWYQEPFSLAGHSLGSFCISLYTENHPAEVKALAPISTVVSGDLFIKNLGAKISLKEWERRGYREWESSSKPGLIKKLNWSFAPDSLRYDLLKQAENIKVPVLLVAGEKDEDTPLSHQRILYDALNTKKELHIFKGAEHTFIKAGHLAELKVIINKWLKNINRF